MIKDEQVNRNSIDDVYRYSDNDNDSKQLEHDEVAAFLEEINQEDISTPFKITNNKDEILERNDEKEKEKNLTKVNVKGVFAWFVEQDGGLIFFHAAFRS